MAFENIRVDSLREAINSCRDSIDHERTNQVITSITDANVWNTNSKIVLKDALEFLVNSKYQDLKNKLNAYVDIPGYIDQYNELKQEISNYRARISELETAISNAPQTTYYSVESGDTLYGIASKHNTTVDEIMGINNIENAGLIFVGQSIALPGGVDTSSMRSEIVELNSLIQEDMNEMNYIEQKVYSMI